ncbi:MAG: 2-C-methyl-D-erythritol 4-phosphate cytidylyltransferase [Pseudomonadota bacterium]
MMHHKAVALIVAAGSGTRCGFAQPKQYSSLRNGCTVLAETLNVFLEDTRFDAVYAVIAEDHKDLYADAIRHLNTPKLKPAIIGGEDRQGSVRNGLYALADQGCDLIFIHDAARPFVSKTLLDRLFEGLKDCDGVVPALAVTDSLRKIDENHITATLDRDQIIAVQTPQLFYFEKIYNAHKYAENHAERHTDDVSVALASGLKVGYVKGDIENMKLTYADDFKRQSLPDIRVGSGYDVHRLIAGEGVILGGITLPCAYKLKGHSDADVLLHTITDAVLGTISAEDIGYHFSPKDPRWKNASSDAFLEHALALLHNAKGVINHIDTTLICEEPKITPHRDAIRANIAALCKLDISKVSVKATTTEGLGFTGRGEGIAAQATVTCMFERDQ